jgi:hypothetical protein
MISGLRNRRIFLFLTLFAAVCLIAIVWKRPFQTSSHEVIGALPLGHALIPGQRLTAPAPANDNQALLMYAELTGRVPTSFRGGLPDTLDDYSAHWLSRHGFVRRKSPPDSGITYHADGLLTVQEQKEALETYFNSRGLRIVPQGRKYLALSKLQ